MYTSKSDIGVNGGFAMESVSVKASIGGCECRGASIEYMSSVSSAQGAVVGGVVLGEYVVAVVAVVMGVGIVRAVLAEGWG